MSAALKSMTGFARGTSEGEAYEVSVEIRSVNHRFLDVRLRGASALAPIEKRVRDRIGAVLSRGKVDVSIQVTPRGESAFTIDIDRPLVEELVRRVRELGMASGIGGDVTVSDVLGFQPAFNVKEREIAEADVWEAVEPALARSLDALSEMRAAEGAELALDMASRTKKLGEQIDAVERRSEERRQARREELQAKVEEILAASVEPPVIAMEVARLVERGDIAEEVTRFRSHLSLWRKTVASGGPCGKKLDFIVQEMNREVNTIGSKSQDAQIAELVITMKSEIERIREQVQNVE